MCDKCVFTSWTSVPNKLVVGAFSFSSSSSSSSQFEALLMSSSVLTWSASLLFYRLMRGKNMSRMKCQWIVFKKAGFSCTTSNRCYSWGMFGLKSLSLMGHRYCLCAGNCDMRNVNWTLKSIRQLKDKWCGSHKNKLYDTKSNIMSTLLL